jgi:hypothetical protein
LRLWLPAEWRIHIFKMKSAVLKVGTPPQDTPSEKYFETGTVFSENTWLRAKVQSG